MNAEMRPADLVEEFIYLRGLKAQASEAFAEFCKEHYDTRMEEIEGKLLNTLNTLGVDSLAGKTGTAYKKISTSVTIADQSTFRRHVIGAEGWDLVNWHANKTVIREMVENNEPLPPGINYNSFYTIGIKRKS